MNLLLLCHGAPDIEKLSTVELKAKQTVQYRGTYGTALSVPMAKYIVDALKKDVTVTEAGLVAGLKGYKASDPIEGPVRGAQDIYLQGDDRLLCFAMNLNTGVWIQLGKSWNTKLGKLVASWDFPFWLNLLCCTELPDANVAQAFVKKETAAGSWKDVLVTKPANVMQD